MSPRRALAAVLTLVLLLGMAPTGWAQPQRGTAEVKRATGRVEVLRKGQTQWLPAVVGARLAEGDDVRAFAGASAELELPDGSTLLVAENSRVIVSKLEFDPQSQSRLVMFHLVVGKVLATVAQATLTLVRARQSNFIITTPTAVAASRGTQFEVVHDGGRQVTRVAVIQKDPRKRTTQGLITCSSFYDRFRTVIVTEDHYTEAGTQGCTPPQPISLLPDAHLVGTASNPITVTLQQLSEPVTPPAIFETPGLITAPTPVFFDPGSPPVSDISAAGPPVVGVDSGPPFGLPPGPPPGVPGPPCPTPAPSPPPPCP